MNFKKYHVTNLLNKSTITTGYRLDSFGNLFEASAYSTSDYISVIPNDTITRNEAFSTNASICEYDSTKTFIQRTTSGSSVTLSNTTQFIRTSFQTSSLDNIQVNGHEWQTKSPMIYKTSTDTITTLPADIYADGNTATIGISGNMVQNGTPAPQNPITPSECGERTANLFSKNDIVTGYALDEYGEPNVNANFGYTNSIAVTPATYTFTNLTQGSTPWTLRVIGYRDSVFVRQLKVVYITTTVTSTQFVVDDTVDSVKISLGIVNRQNLSILMLNKGGQPLPYEPYGYKIPILSDSTTTPVYLGEVETTRQIKQLVLTGDEGWKNLTSDNTRFYLDVITPDYIRADSQITYMCTHYIPYGQTISGLLVPNLYMSMSSAPAQRLYITDSNYTSVDDFKAYLAQQYAAGTPVTVWYILATPATGIVNEPIRKIGEYADTVSGISIPTIAGKDTFDVLTTLKPSEVSLSYTGWHDATVKEWDGSQWNE